MVFKKYIVSSYYELKFGSVNLKKNQFIFLFACGTIWLYLNQYRFILRSEILYELFKMDCNRFALYKGRSSSIKLQGPLRRGCLHCTLKKLIVCMNARGNKEVCPGHYPDITLYLSIREKNKMQFSDAKKIGNLQRERFDKNYTLTGNTISNVT